MPLTWQELLRQPAGSVIVDDYEIAGGGIITEALKDLEYDHKNIRWSGDAMTEAERVKLLGNSGLVVWMTGLSGSGKTTTAQEVERRLVARASLRMCSTGVS